MNYFYHWLEWEKTTSCLYFFYPDNFVLFYPSWFELLFPLPSVLSIFLSHFNLPHFPCPCVFFPHFMVHFLLPLSITLSVLYLPFLTSFPSLSLCIYVSYHPFCNHPPRSLFSSLFVWHLILLSFLFLTTHTLIEEEEEEEDEDLHWASISPTDSAVA